MMTKISVPDVCRTCNPAEISFADFVASPVLLDLRADPDGRYMSECSRGHHRKVTLRQQSFQIHYELAALAIRDRHYQRAVSCCIASLEDFQEFFLRAMAYQNEITKERF